MSIELCLLCRRRRKESGAAGRQPDIPLPPSMSTQPPRPPSSQRRYVCVHPVSSCAEMSVNASLKYLCQGWTACVDRCTCPFPFPFSKCFHIPVLTLITPWRINMILLREMALRCSKSWRMQHESCLRKQGKVGKLHTSVFDVDWSLGVQPLTHAIASNRKQSRAPVTVSSSNKFCGMTKALSGYAPAPAGCQGALPADCAGCSRGNRSAPAPAAPAQWTISKKAAEAGKAITMKWTLEDCSYNSCIAATFCMIPVVAIQIERWLEKEKGIFLWKRTSKRQLPGRRTNQLPVKCDAFQKRE